MPLVKTSDLQGIADIPASKPACLAWLRRTGFTPIVVRQKHLFELSALPEEVRKAYLQRHFDGLDLDPGEYDDAAHAAFMEAIPSRRQRAEQKG